MIWCLNLCLIVLMKLASGSGIDEYPIGNTYGKARIKPNSKPVADLNEYVLYPTSVESSDYDSMPQYQTENYQGWCPECSYSKPEIYESRRYQPQSYISREKEFNIPEEENVYILDHYESDRQSRPRYARLLHTKYYDMPVNDEKYIVRNGEVSYAYPEVDKSYVKQNDHSRLPENHQDIYSPQYDSETDVIRHTRHPYISGRYFQYHPSFGLEHNPKMRRFLPTGPNAFVYSTGMNAGNHYVNMHSSSGQNIGQNHIKGFSYPDVKFSGKSFMGYENLYKPGNIGSSLLNNVNTNEIGKASQQLVLQHIKENHQKDANSYKNIHEKTETFGDLNNQISQTENHYTEEHVHEENEEKFFHEESETITKQQLTRHIELSDDPSTSKSIEYKNDDERKEISSSQEFHSTEKHFSESEVIQSIEVASSEKVQLSQSSEQLSELGEERQFSLESHTSENRQYDDITKSSSENKVSLSSEKHFSGVSNELSSLEKVSSSQEIVHSSEKHISMSKEIDITSKEYSKEFGEEANYKSEQYVSSNEESSSSIENHSEEVVEQIHSFENGGGSSKIEIYRSKEVDYGSEKHSSESKEIVYKSSEDNYSNKGESHKSIEIHNSENKEEHESLEKHLSEYELQSSKERKYDLNIHTSKSSEASLSAEKHYSVGYTSSEKHLGSRENYLSSEKHFGSKESHFSSEKHFGSMEKHVSLEKIHAQSSEKFFGSKEFVYESHKHSSENRDFISQSSGSKEINFYSKPLHKEILHSCEDDVIKVADEQFNQIYSPVRSEVVHISETPETSNLGTQMKNCQKKFHVIETKNFNRDLYKQLPDEGTIFSLDSTSYEDVADNIKNEITERRHNRFPCTSPICNAALYDISSLQFTKGKTKENILEVNPSYIHNSNSVVGSNSLHHVFSQQYQNKIPTEYEKKVCKKRRKYCPSSNRNKCDCVRNYQELEPRWPERNLHFENKLKLRNKTKFLRHTSEMINPEINKDSQLESTEIDERLGNVAVIYSSFV